MESLLTILLAIISSGVISTLIVEYRRYLERKEDKKDRKQELADEERSALRLLMKDRLRFLCVSYIQQGWIYEDELDDLIDMHKCYHDKLEGNGYLDELMKRVKALEIRGIGVK